MYEPDFRDTWGKFHRGGYHIQTCENMFTQKFSTQENSPRIGIQFKAYTREHVVYISHMPEVEEALLAFSLVIGDAVHNLRSSLDHLAFQLALKNTDGNVIDQRRIQFPIESGKESFKNRCTATGRSGYIADLHPDDRAIIKRFQPCWSNEEGQFLGVLRDLNDADKHRLVAQLTVPGNYIHGGDERVEAIMRVFFESNDLASTQRQISSIELGTELYRATMPDWPETNVDMAGYIVPVITLRDSGNPPRLVGATLNLMSNAVFNVLSEFSPPM